MFFEEKDGIVYKTVTGNDYCQVAGLLCDSFYSRTPLSWPLGGPLMPEEVETAFCQLGVVISHRVSILAFDAVTREIVGVRLAVVSDKCGSGDGVAGESGPLLKPLLESPELAARYPRHSRIARLQQHLEAQADCLARYHVGRAIVDQLLVVKASHANRHIGRRLIECSMRLCKALRVPVLVCSSHNAYSHRIYRSLGFDCAYSVRFRDYVDELDGTKPFLELDDTEHTEAAIFACRL